MMKIVSRLKFVRAIVVLVLILFVILILVKNTYSKVDIEYREIYVYAGDTLWTIATKECIDNKYFKNKDIRYIVDELKNVNNLQVSDLVEGEKLKIPQYK